MLLQDRSVEKPFKKFHLLIPITRTHTYLYLESLTLNTRNMFKADRIYLILTNRAHRIIV